MDTGKKPILFMLPFAGGSALSYEKWKLGCATCKAIEYSGHGFRFRQPLISDKDELIDDILSEMNKSLADEEYFLFGHSMGGLLAWLTARKTIASEIKSPKRVIISGCVPPEFLDTDRYNKYSSEEEVLAYLQKFGRVSEKRLYSKQMKQYYLPIIQHDFGILAELKKVEAKPLDIPMSVIYSKEDSLMDHTKIGKWVEYGKDVSFFEVKGDHFYLEEESVIQQMFQIIKECITM